MNELFEDKHTQCIFLQGETVSTRPTVVLHQEDEQTTAGMLTQYSS